MTGVKLVKKTSLTKNSFPDKNERVGEDSGSKSIILKKRKQKENVLSVLDSITKNFSETLLSVDTEAKIEESVCSQCKIDTETFQNIYQFWISKQSFVSASYLLTEFERSLGTSECILTESKYKNCIRLGERKGLSNEDSTAFVNIFITKYNMRLEKEVLQEAKSLIQTWCQSNLSNKKYTTKDLEKLNKIVTESFTALSAQRIQRCIDEFIRTNEYSEKKGLFGIGFLGL